MVDKINIRNLNMEELSGVVSLYPWYGGARMELCRRMAASGALTQTEAVQNALYLNSRQMLSKLLVEDVEQDYTDTTAGAPEENRAPVREFIVAGGDYFSKAQYEKAGREDDNIFSKFATKARENGYKEDETAGSSSDFYTETLAQIYLEQEYPERAIEIYSKLSLRYPEKSVYFAALIEEYY